MTKKAITLQSSGSNCAIMCIWMKAVIGVMQKLHCEAAQQKFYVLFAVGVVLKNVQRHTFLVPECHVTNFGVP